MSPGGDPLSIPPQSLNMILSPLGLRSKDAAGHNMWENVLCVSTEAYSD